MICESCADLTDKVVIAAKQGDHDKARLFAAEHAASCMDRSGDGTKTSCDCQCKMKKFLERLGVDPTEHDLSVTAANVRNGRVPSGRNR